MQPTNRKSLRSDELVLQLLEIMKQLRDKDNGFPWDKQQTFETISKYTIEEAYEVVEAISTSANSNIIGDGKIFVVDLNQLVRIRTGDLNEDAL